MNIQEKIKSGINYSNYREMIDALMAEDKTTGENHSEAMVHYTKMNVQRMSRLDKTTDINEDLAAAAKVIDKPQTWLILTEAWCGDAAQNIPVIQKLADLNSNIDVRLILRDENLDLMDAYLTNGGRSIPKMIVLDADNQKELATWGPRPAPVQQMVLENKQNPATTYAEFAKKVQLWYAKDKTQTAQNELLEMMNKINSAEN